MILLIFPNQLYDKHPGLKHDPQQVVLLEDSLFFGDPNYPAHFHKQKLWLHRASMKRYQAELSEKGYECQYRDYDPDKPLLLEHLKQIVKSNESGGKTLCTVDPIDFILERRLSRACNQLGLQLELLPSPGFINSSEQNHDYRAGKNRWFMADFYKWQRQRLDILIEAR